MISLELGIRYSEKLYHISRLTFNEDSGELFYQFKYDKPHKLARKYDEKINPTKILTRLPDHISFHKDGEVHIRYKDFKNKKQKDTIFKMPGSLNEMPTTGFAPLLIHSLKPSLSQSILPELKDPNNLSITWEMNGIEKMSIVIFLIGKKVGYGNMLKSHGFDATIDIPFSKAIMLTDQYNLLFGFSRRILVEKVKSDINVESSFVIAPTEEVLQGKV